LEASSLVASDIARDLATHLLNSFPNARDSTGQNHGSAINRGHHERHNTKRSSEEDHAAVIHQRTGPKTCGKGAQIDRIVEIVVICGRPHESDLAVNRRP